MTSKIAENFRKYFRITDEDRARMTPEEIASLEAFAQRMMNDENPPGDFNERKFDASEAIKANARDQKKEPQDK